MLARNEMSRTCLLTILAVAACGDHPGATDDTPDTGPATPGCDAWHQWGNNASHDGTSCVRGQPLAAMLSDMVYDPFIAQEVADAKGDLIPRPRRSRGRR